MNIQGSQESAVDRHLKMKRDIAFTVEFLKKFGGNDLRFNQFSETIFYLDGIFKGMNMSDNAQESIAHEKERTKPEVSAR
jgi:hypothetical protein